MIFSPEDLTRILMAIAAGGLIGLEREFRDKSAGFRTLIFIASGAALFTILSNRLAFDKDPTRIAANIVTGIGFLGAGAILREGMRITGLTTAASIWLTAAVGMAMGGGEFALGWLVTLLSLIVLWLFPSLEHAVDLIREERSYEVILANDLEKRTAVETALLEAGLKIMTHHHIRKGGDMICRWGTVGGPKKHEKFIRYLLTDPDIKEFTY
ncbi:MAG: MgtC/SapB family protein [Chloroflexota bacterium]